MKSLRNLSKIAGNITKIKSIFHLLSNGAIASFKSNYNNLNANYLSKNIK
jgi:hypothetical protein